MARPFRLLSRLLMLLLAVGLLAHGACGARPPVVLAEIPRPIVFAHRGGSGEGPENTLRAMTAALARDPDWPSRPTCADRATGTS